MTELSDNRVGQRDILNIDEAAELLGVSVKTFNKVLHADDIPARKIGREWKFSRQALIDWVGRGRSQDFYDGINAQTDEERELTPHGPGGSGGLGGNGGANHSTTRDDPTTGDKPRARRTAGWHIDLD